MAIGTTAAILGAAAIGAGTSMAASSKAAKATKNASEQASETARTTAESNNALQREVYGQNRQTLAPFVGQGVAANQTLAAILGLPTQPGAASSSTDWGRYVADNGGMDAWEANPDLQAQYGGDINAYGQALHEAGFMEQDLSPYTTTTNAPSAVPNVDLGYANNLRDQMSGANSATARLNSILGLNGGAGGRTNPYTAQIDSLVGNRSNPYTAQVDGLIASGPQSKAGSAITALLGLGGDKAAADAAFGQYRGSTGYDFRQGEGQKGLTASLGAQGMLNSGSAVKSALRYNQNLASGEFGNYIGQLGGLYSSDIGQYNTKLGATQGQQALNEQQFGTQLSALQGQQGFNEGQYNNNLTALMGQQGYASGQWQDYLNSLTGQQGIGLSAANAQAGVGTNFANASNTNSSNAANVAAQAALASGNAAGNAALSTGNAINSALGNASSAYAFNQGMAGMSPAAPALSSSYNWYRDGA